MNFVNNFVDVFHDYFCLLFFFVASLNRYGINDVVYHAVYSVFASFFSLALILICDDHELH